MSLERYKDLIRTVGKSAAHMLYPNDFEYYYMTFEVYNSQNTLVISFSFPVLPDDFSQTNTSLSSISKTAGGVAVNFNPTFNPVDIKISGNFGRRFRLLIGDLSTDFNSFLALRSENTFDFSVKNGYGSTKILEKIHKKATELDEYGKPYKIFFLNFALNSHWLIEPNSLQLSQNVRSSNMIWNYNLQMTGVAPASLLLPALKANLVQILSANLLTQSLNISVNELTDLVKSIKSKRR